MMAIGQFQMLFLAASQTHRIPENTPSHSNIPVPKTNWERLSLNASRKIIWQMYILVLVLS